MNPSLELWLKLAEDAEIPPRRAVLLWIREDCPSSTKRSSNCKTLGRRMPRFRTSKRKGQARLLQVRRRERMRETLVKDKTLPRVCKTCLRTTGCGRFISRRAMRLIRCETFWASGKGKQIRLPRGVATHSGICSFVLKLISDDHGILLRFGIAPTVRSCRFSIRSS